MKSGLAWLLLLGVGGMLFLAGCGWLQNPPWLPAGPEGEIFIRRIPAAMAIEAEKQGVLEKVWPEGLRQNTRYLAAAGCPLQFPLVITVPAWQEASPQPEGIFYIQSILLEREQYPNPKETGLSVVSLAAVSAACYTWKGPYTYENFARAWRRVRSFLEEKEIPVTGPPRLLIHINPDFTWDRWQVAELQVPVPDQN